MNDGMLTVSNSEFGKLEILMEDGKELFSSYGVREDTGLC